MAKNITDVDAAKPLPATVAELQLAGRALIVFLCDCDSKWDDAVRSVANRVLIPAALEAGACLFDDARVTGGAQLLGEAAAAQDKAVTLVGVVESGRRDADIDGQHAAVLRLPKEWTDTSKYTFQIVDELVRGSDGSRKPAVAVLMGGGEAEKKAVVRCARRGWPVLVMAGAGGLADEMANALGNGAKGTEQATDAEMNEIAETATIFAASLGSDCDDLHRMLAGQMAEAGRDSRTLEQAWRRFDEWDLTAVAKQARYRKVEAALLALAVLAILFAISSAPGAVPEGARAWAHAHGLPAGTLHLLVLVTPILLSVAGAYNGHFREGAKWILLRGAAEALKREIFRFRARAGVYSEEQCWQTSRELKLAAKMKEISSALEQSEVNMTDVVAAGPSRSERTKALSADEYAEVRLREQARHYAAKIAHLTQQLNWLYLLIAVGGAAGTLLAAIGLPLWVALATACATALKTKLQADQVENRLMQYNQASNSLRNIDAWWSALTRWEKGRRKNIELLVEQGEKAMESETALWVQQMQSGLEKLTEKEQRPGGSEAGKN